MASFAWNLIARDGAKDLPILIPQLKRLTDEIVISVDSRTIDNTLQVAKDLGCNAFLYEWKDGGFSAARNSAIEKTKADWIAWTDCDDRVPALDGFDAIKKFLEKSGEDKKFILTFRVRNAPGNTLFSQVRMFPNNPEVRFVYRIHETIDATVKDRGFTIAQLDGMIVDHHGYEDKHKLQAKFQRNLPEMEREIKSGSFCPSIKFTYATNLKAIGKFKQSDHWFFHNITDEVKDSAFRDVYIFSILSFSKSLVFQRKYTEAEYFINLGLKCVPDFKELHVLRAYISSCHGDKLIGNFFLENSMKCPQRDYSIATNWQHVNSQISLLSAKLS